MRECLKTNDGFESLVVMSMLRGEHECKTKAEQTIIRIAVPEDAEAIVSVLAQSFAEHETSYTPQGYAAIVLTVEEIRARFGEGEIWGIEQGEA